MTSSEWQESVEKLASEFDNGHPGSGSDAAALRSATAAADTTGELTAQIKTGVLSPLQEDEGHYYAVAVMNKGKDRLKLATVAWPKEPLRSWLAKAETQVPVTMAAVSANYTLPVISGQSDNSISSVACTDDTWTATHHQRARWPIHSHGSVDRQRNDRLGRMYGDFTGTTFEHRRAIQSQH